MVTAPSRLAMQPPEASRPAAAWRVVTVEPIHPEVIEKLDDIRRAFRL
jgi:hypothetical protein